MATEPEREAGEIHRLRAEVYRQRAKDWRARQATGAKAKLRAAGLTQERSGRPSKKQQQEALGELYMALVTEVCTPPDLSDAFPYLITDQFVDEVAFGDWFEAHALEEDARARGDVVPEEDFDALVDRSLISSFDYFEEPIPLTPERALDVVHHFSSRNRSGTWDVLNDALKARIREGEKGYALPPRPNRGS